MRAFQFSLRFVLISFVVIAAALAVYEHERYQRAVIKSLRASDSDLEARVNWLERCTDAQSRRIRKLANAAGIDETDGDNDFLPPDLLRKESGDLPAKPAGESP